MMPQSYPQLIPSEPLLENRISKEWFSYLPKKPGVYRFYDDAGLLLYVGKAKNLRNRLFSYKRAKSGQVSSKVSKLIARISTIELDITDSELDALLMENRLIRQNRPEYNRINKETETYYFVYFKPGVEGLEFRLAMRIHDETDPNNWYGCLKGHASVRRAMGCLLRFLWMTEHTVVDPMHLPVQLTRNLTPMRFYLAWGENSVINETNGFALVQKWLMGESCELLDWFAVHLDYSQKPDRPIFQNLHFEYQLECLKWYYDRKLVQHRILRKGRRLIAQDEIDDEMVKVFVDSPEYPM
ncbi:MAG: nucleotide excision repair endonuclease [Balneolaceae bacterium]